MKYPEFNFDFVDLARMVASHPLPQAGTVGMLWICQGHLARSGVDSFLIQATLHDNQGREWSKTYLQIGANYWSEQFTGGGTFEHILAYEKPDLAPWQLESSRHLPTDHYLGDQVKELRSQTVRILIDAVSEEVNYARTQAMAHEITQATTHGAKPARSGRL